MRRGVAGLVAAAALAAPAASQAGDGDEARPAPACAEVEFRDDRGEVDNAGLDLVAAFLSAREREVHVNLMIAHLDGSVGEADTGIEFFQVDYYDDAGHLKQVEARLYDNGARTGATWFDGPDGIVRIALPGLTPRTSTRISAVTGSERDEARVEIGYPPLRELLGDTAVHIGREEVDELEPRRTSALCASRSGATGSRGEPETPAARPEAARAPTITIGTPMRARGRVLRVPLRSTARVTDVRGRLSRAGRVIARGRLKQLDGRGVLVLTARRALRPGVYLLTIPGAGERRVRIG